MCGSMHAKKMPKDKQASIEYASHRTTLLDSKQATQLYFPEAVESAEFVRGGGGGLELVVSARGQPHLTYVDVQTLKQRRVSSLAGNTRAAVQFTTKNKKWVVFADKTLAGGGVAACIYFFRHCFFGEIFDKQLDPLAPLSPREIQRSGELERERLGHARVLHGHVHGGLHRRQVPPRRDRQEQVNMYGVRVSCNRRVTVQTFYLSAAALVSWWGWFFPDWHFFPPAVGRGYSPPHHNQTSPDKVD